MKKILLITSVCFLTNTGLAQFNSGLIVYERKVNMHKRLTGQQESMKNMIPEFTTAKMKLMFVENESIYKAVEETEDIREQTDNDDERIVLRMDGDNEVYKNYLAGKMVELRELGPKKYIIEDSIRSFSWKLDDSETKIIKDYTCKKATAKNSQGMTLVAWFSDQINCPSGPEIFGGLPGLILELNIGDDEIVFLPLDIKKGIDSKLVQAPNAGKTISRKEFQKMMDDQSGGNGEGGGPVIRIRRN